MLAAWGCRMRAAKCQAAQEGMVSAWKATSPATPIEVSNRQGPPVSSTRPTHWDTGPRLKVGAGDWKRLMLTCRSVAAQKAGLIEQDGK